MRPRSPEAVGLMHDLQHEASAMRAAIRHLAEGEGDPAPVLAELRRKVARLAERDQALRGPLLCLLDELGDGPGAAA